MSLKLERAIMESNELLKGLTAAIDNLANQIREQSLTKHSENSNYKTHSSGKRVHYKIEDLGLVETVVDLLNKGYTYVQISNQLGNRVSKSAIHRFAKRHKIKS